MSLLVDIEKDTFYIQRVEKGSQAAQRKMIINLINKLGLDDKMISELTDVPVKVIRSIRKEIQK